MPVRGPRPLRTATNLDPVRALVDRQYAQRLSVTRLAKAAGLSRYHFIRAFRQAYGLTPHQYVRERRIDRAKELLVTTPIAVTEICERIGLSSLGSFSRAFRALTGESPAAFRRKRRRSVYIPSCFVRMYRAERPRDRTFG
jgi:AraC-like DNA-binding protein